MKSIRYFLLSFFVVGVLFAVVSVELVSADSNCVIPESGPWPPCATGGSTQPANPPPSNTTDACVIPESGPWPPCASGGTTPANAQETRRYAQWEVRNIFIDIFNKDFGMADGEYGYLNKWQPDTTITFNNGIMRMTSQYHMPNGDVIYHDFGASFSVAHGEPTVDTHWLEIGSRQIGGEDLELVEDFIELFFRVRLYEELDYADVSSVQMDDNELIVIYR